MGFPTPEQGDKIKAPVAHTHLIKVESLPPPPWELNIPSPDPCNQLCLQEILLEQSDCLGIKIDNRLCWKPHITASCKKFCSNLKFIRRIKGLPAKVLEEIHYKGIILSITYCISACGKCSPPPPPPLINSLEDVHIRAGRTIHKLKPSVKDNEVLSKIGWSPLQYIYKRRLAIIM